MASKRMPKVILCAQGADRRTPGRKPAKQYWWLGIWETAKTANQHKSNPKWYPKVPKINENGVQNRWEIDEKSRLRRRCDFGAFREPQRTTCLTFLGPLFATIFGQESQKTWKKINTVIGHCPGALQERKKNDFWEARKTSCFLDGFFIENGLLFETIFNEKPFKNPCWFWTRKSYVFWWKINVKTAWVLALFLFYFFGSFSKSA